MEEAERLRRGTLSETEQGKRVTQRGMDPSKEEDTEGGTDQK